MPRQCGVIQQSGKCPKIYDTVVLSPRSSPRIDGQLAQPPCTPRFLNALVFSDNEFSFVVGWGDRPEQTIGLAIRTGGEVERVRARFRAAAQGHGP
jgi:hypothetical protein